MRSRVYVYRSASALIGVHLVSLALPRNVGPVATVVGCCTEDRGIESRQRRLHFDGGEMLSPVYCAMSLHGKEPQVVKISGAFSTTAFLIVIAGFGT